MNIETRDFLGLQLSTSSSFDDGEPRCRDVDLGKFLGYSRPRDVRKLIERELEAKNLSGSHVRAVVAREEPSAGKHPAFEDSRHAKVEYWLTEPGALFVASRSETKAGAEVLKSLIDSWVLARTHDRRVVGIIQLCWANEPKPVQRMFGDLIQALLDMRGEDRAGQGAPPWARLLASMVYGWAFGANDETGQQTHRRTTEPECKRPDYWWLNEDGLKQLRRTIDAGIDYSYQAIDWEQWVAMMRRRFEGRALQLYFGQELKRLAPKKQRASK